MLLCVNFWNQLEYPKATHKQGEHDSLYSIFKLPCISNRANSKESIENLHTLLVFCGHVFTHVTTDNNYVFQLSWALVYELFLQCMVITLHSASQFSVMWISWYLLSSSGLIFNGQSITHNWQALTWNHCGVVMLKTQLDL